MAFRMGLALSTMVPMVFLLSACGSPEATATRLPTATAESVTSTVAARSPTLVPVPTPTPDLTLDLPPTPTLQQVVSPTPVPVATPSPQPTATQERRPPPSPTATPENGSAATSVPSPVPTPEPTATRVTPPTPTPTPTTARTPTPVPSPTATLPPTPTPTAMPQSVNETNFPLTLPAGFRISMFTLESIGPLRFMAFSPDGILFVSMPSTEGLYSGSEGGTVFALPDRDQNGVADEVRTVIEGLNNRPHGLAFYGGYLYLAEENRVSRYSYLGNGNLGGTRAVLADLPTGGGHLSRTVGFSSSDKMYVSIG